MKFKDNIFFKAYELGNSVWHRRFECDGYKIYSYDDGVGYLLHTLLSDYLQHTRYFPEYYRLKFKNGDEMSGEFHLYEVFDFLHDRDVEELEKIYFKRNIFYFEPEKNIVRYQYISSERYEYISSIIDDTDDKEGYEYVASIIDNLDDEV